MKSSKVALKCLFKKTLKYDTQSVTGYNFRRIMSLVNKNSVDELNLIDSNDVTQMPPPVSEIWKINMVKEITDIKFGVKSL